jgi:Tfp pilus assembly protein PilW
MRLYESVSMRDISGARRGLTLVELCFGLVITSLVVGAVGAFTLAVAQHWKQSDAETVSTARARQSSLALGRNVQEARLMGAVRPGSLDGSNPEGAAALLWVSDTNKDGSIQGAECAMLEHDPATKSIKLYDAGQGDASTALSWAVFTDQAVLNNFKVGRVSRPLAGGVKGARFAAFNVGDPTQSPSLEYTLQVEKRNSDQTALEYGTCSIRAPGKQPS